MPRPKIGLEQHQTQLIALYTDGLTCTQLSRRMKEEHGLEIPDRTLKRRLAEWGILKKMPHRDLEELKPRIQAFWDLNLDDADMAKILQSENYRIPVRTVARIRHQMGLKRRNPGGDKPPEPVLAETLSALPTRDSPSDQLLASASSPPQEIHSSTDAEADSDSSEEVVNPARPWANRNHAQVGSLADRVAELTGVKPPQAAQNVAPMTPSGTKNPVGRPKGSKDTKKRKRVVLEDDEDAIVDMKEFQRVKDQNEEMQQLMDALREEADDSKAKMLAKAKDDAEKYRRIKVLESEVQSLRTTNERLMDTSGNRDERIYQVTIAKNSEVDRVKVQLAECRVAFRNASVRVFKYQQNCATFLAGLRRNDPNYSRETTEAELLTEELEKCFNADELTAIRSQVHGTE